MCNDLELDGLIIIGGDDSNTNAAVLAEYFKSINHRTHVIGCPKTIDGDLKNEYIPISFGFDTACKIYSELIGNICVDALSAQKYYHFVRLMGRSASHITMECAFETHPNYTFIGEEISSARKSVKQITQEVVELVVERARVGKNYGVILLPEGLIEFIPEMGALIAELNDVIAAGHTEQSDIAAHLQPAARELFEYLPQSLRDQLTLDRDSHGNVKVSQIETEKFIVSCVEKELAELKRQGKYDGSFNTLCHFFGYEGRCGLPSCFDTNYCYALGYNAGILIHEGLNGGRERRVRRRHDVDDQQSGHASRAVDGGRRADHDDDEHRTTQRKGRAGDPQGVGGAGRLSVQAVPGAVEGVASERLLQLPGSDPVHGSRREHHQPDAGVRNQGAEDEAGSLTHLSFLRCLLIGRRL